MRSCVCQFSEVCSFVFRVCLFCVFIKTMSTCIAAALYDAESRIAGTYVYMYIYM